MIASDQRGFTLVELITAISIFMVVATASVILFIGVLQLRNKTKVVEEIQREGDSVVSHMSRNLRDAVAVDTANSNFSTDPNSIRVRLADNNFRRYYVTNNQLHYVSESGSDQLLQQPGTTVTSLTFKAGSDTTGLQVITARISLQRTKGNYSQTLTFGSTVNTRPQ